jgi:hypothetical protein
MQLTFDIGDATTPKGHALVYFRGAVHPGKVFATYLVVFPLKINIAKYVPPFLASSLGGASMGEISSFPMPPAPEEVESYDWLVRLAKSRSDDLIFGGDLGNFDVAVAMQTVSEIAQRYTDMWDRHNKTQTAAAETPAVEKGTAFNEVMFGLLGERDKLGELSRLLVRLRFAVESRDRLMERDVEEEMRLLGRHLPEEYKIERVIHWAKDPSDKGARLAQLYVDRCYSLSDKDQSRIGNLEQEIQSLES